MKPRQTGHQDDAPGHNCAHHSASDSNVWFDWLRLFACGATIAVHWTNVLSSWQYAPQAFLLAVALFSFPIFKGGWQSIKQTRMTMSLSMTIAVIAALFLQEPFTALVITFFYLIAEEIERFTIVRGRSTVKTMLEFLPATTFVNRAGKISEIEIAELELGDVVIAKPGTRIVVDGTVISGESFVDEAAITGESLPVEKFPGKQVYAGSVNRSGALTIKAESLGKDTAFGRMVAAVEAAEHSQGAVQKLADKLSAYLVGFSLIMAAVTYYFTGDLHQTISVVIVAGACGIAAGTPLAIFSALGRAAHNGAIVKGGTHMETLALVDTVVFDKSGTLTLGQAHVARVQTAPYVTDYELLHAAYSADMMSDHPAAKAIVEHAKTRGLEPSPVKDFHYLAGRGVRCLLNGEEVLLVGNRKLLAENKVAVTDDFAKESGYTEVFVARAGRFLGAIHIADRIRPEAYEAVTQLKKMGIKTLLLSGDTMASAGRVAKQLGISEYSGGLKPEEKQRRIVALKDEKRIVAMVGDGINDAPALVTADVGVAVGSGTDVAMESADVILLGSNLLKFVEAIRIAKRCRRIIIANLVGTILIDAIGMALAFFGLLSPVLAAIVHAGAEVFCLFNSARLLPWRYARETLERKREEHHHLKQGQCCTSTKSK